MGDVKYAPLVMDMPQLNSPEGTEFKEVKIAPQYDLPELPQ
jgi:hypothetical protein